MVEAPYVGALSVAICEDKLTPKTKPACRTLVGFEFFLKKERGYNG